MWRKRQPKRPRKPEDVVLRVARDGNNWKVTRGSLELRFFHRGAAIEFALSQARSMGSVAEVYLQDEGGCERVYPRIQLLDS